MNFPRVSRVLAFVVGVPLALVYWPTACANTVSGPAAEPAGQTATGGLPIQEAPQPKGVLPHPAFAFAGPDASAASIADIAERATPSVVSIASKRQVEAQPFPFAPFFFGPQGPREQQGLGSGVIVSADGIVLTNHHVVEQATEIRVTTADDRQFDAELVGSDAKSDLAVLRLQGDVGTLEPLQVGDSSHLRLGDIVLAIGNPFGVGQTVTMGIVSAKGRADVGIVDYEDFIQTDAAINPGNSGGALVNMRGELVGINTAILSRSGGYQGIGFAIPTSMAKPIMQSLIEHGKVVRGFLGIGIQDIDAELKRAMNLSTTQGVLVTEVQPGSGAEKAGLQRGDVVVAVDGQPVETTGKLRNLIAAKGAEATVALKVIRSGKEQLLEVILGALPEPGTGSKAGGAKGAPHDSLGMKLAPLDARQRQMLRLPEDAPGKVVIVGIAPGSQADKAGLRPGDILLEVGRREVNDVASAQQRLNEGKGDVLLVVRRGGGNRFVVLKR